MKTTLLILCLPLSLNQLQAQNSICVDEKNQTGVETGSPVTPFSTLSPAVAAAQNGDTIKVATGTYEPIIISEKKIHLIGGYKGAFETNYQAGLGGNFDERESLVPSSEIIGNPTQACIYYSIEQAAINGSATIKGFLLREGLRGITLFGDYSGFLSDIVIEENELLVNGTEDIGQYGGAIGFEGKNITIRNNWFEGNKAGRGAAIGRTAGNPENFLIENNRILYNTGYDDHAGAVYLNGTGRILNNHLEGNRAAAAFNYGWGGAIMVYNYDTTKLIELAYNRYFNNQAPSRGAALFVDEAAKVWIHHELISGNFNTTGEGGAAIYVDADFDNNPSVARIENCTIADNTSGLAEGGGVYVQASITQIENCIFWNNGGDDFHLSPDGQAAAALTVNYSTSQETISGTGNLHSDPYFVAATNQDYHLQSTSGHFDEASGQFTSGDPQYSPAIDAGNPQSDFGLETNPNGDRINQGCYGNTAEASRSQSVGTEQLIADELKIYPNPISKELHLPTHIGNWEIHTASGQKLDLKAEHNIINIQQLPAGTYYLSTQDSSYPFIIL